MDRFDIAFSLLGTDEGVASAIQSHIPSDHSSFLYSSRQRELLSSGDGLNAFPAVFRTSRVCVVLFREGWGKSPWTRLEEQTIGDRYMREGSGFLLFVRLDRTAELAPWIPIHSLWVDYQSEGAKNTAAYIVARLSGPDGRVLATSRTFGRQSIPIARYQAQGVHGYATYIPTDPVVCDGCSAAVQFRPIVGATLPTHEGLAAASEQLCPRCARERGIRVSAPRGMKEESLYAPQNPTFAQHVKHRLSDHILQALTGNRALRSHGVTSVGAMFAGTEISLLVSREGRESLKVALRWQDLERSRTRSDSAILECTYSRILVAVQESEGVRSGCDNAAI